MKIDDKYAFWRWSRIIREKQANIDRDAKAISELKTAIRDNADRQQATAVLCRELQEVARESKANLATLTEAKMQIYGQHEAAMAEVEKLRDHLEIAQNEMVRTELDKSRSELELAKARVIMEQLKMDLDKEKREIAERDHKFKIVSDWIVATHRLKVAPIGRGIRDMLQKAAKLIVFLFLLLPMFLAAQQPPPLLRNPFTTNTPAWTQTNVTSLSSSNATSKPITNHYQDGVLTLYGLEAAGSVTLSVNGTNILITGTAGGSGFSTNGNQFGPSLELTIKNGAFLTNMNYWGPGTNQGILWLGGDILPIPSNSEVLGNASHFWAGVELGDFGVIIHENGGSTLDAISIVSPGTVASYTLTLPRSQGANGQVITNDGAGLLGWWTPVSSGGSGLTTNANQFLGVPLSIKTGAFQTNFNGWGEATNQGGVYFDTLSSLAGNQMVSDSFPDLFIGSASYDSVGLFAAGRVISLSGTAVPPVFYPSSGDGIIDLGYPTLRWKEFWLREDAYIGGHVEATQYVVTNSPGLDRDILFYNTNGQGYTSISGPTNQWLPTNRFFLLVTNPAAGQSLKFLNVSAANGVSSIVLTNDFFQPASAALSNAVGSITNQAWVEMTGNDATGTYGDRTKPFRTLWAAISNTFAPVNPPWMINVGPGSFTNGDVALVVSNGCWIVGSGRDATELVFNFPLDTNGTAIWPRDNSRLYNVTVNQTWTNSLAAPIGSYGSFAIIPQGAYTNVYTYGCRFLGKSDNLYSVVTTGPCIMTNDLCLFDGGRNSWDLVATAGHTNSVWTYNNCLFTTYGPATLGAQTMRLGNLFEGTNVFNHCTLICDGSTGSIRTEGIVMHDGISAGTPKGQLELNDCYLYTSALSGTVTDIVNTVSGKVIIRGPFSTNNCIGPMTVENYQTLYNKFGPGAFSQVGITNVSTNGVTMTTNSVMAVQPIIGLDFVSGITGYVSYGTAKLGVSASGNGGLTTNANQFGASVELTIKSGALVTNLSSLNLTNRGDMTNAGTIIVGGAGRFETNVLVLGTNDARYLKLSGGVDRRVILRTDDNTNVVATTIGTGLTFDGTTLSTSFSGLETNANQFAASTTLAIKEGALLTNTLFWQSNTTGPATIYTMTIGAITNVAEWRQSNSTPSVVINSNAQISFGPENIKTAIAFRTNQIDLSTYQWKPFTNSLQTNIVLQITNLMAGVQTTLDIYGAGIFGGTVTNAWNVLLTASAGTTIKWPVGATNGNFDVLVNSNQVVQINLWPSRTTNVLASYKAFE